jgi:anti-sigma regulatory factor (Ser/Thr protein kinase)
VNSSAPLWQRTSRVTREVWLAAEASAPRYARAFVPGVLVDWGLEHLREDAELVASELVTNALRVTCTARPASFTAASLRRAMIRVRLVLLEGSLIIEVWDQAVARPSPARSMDPDAENGRGMLIVEALSAQWNSYDPAEGGKWVWAELRLAGALL